jgi:8-oxo-dGTP pyrophosphatase MutT (NUDIX family)
VDLVELARRRRSFPQHVRNVLAQYPRRVARASDLTSAAVLLPLLYKEGQWHVLFTRRTQNVEHHKGQISFPGGASEPTDENLAATALRETYEEIGVPPSAIGILGALDDFPTITDFLVTPFVGILSYPLSYHLNPNEVEAVLEVPLSFFVDPAGLRVEPREYRGQVFDVLFWDHGPHTIWGATARILKGFLDLLTWAPDPRDGQ